MSYRILEPGQAARIHIYDVATSEDTVVFESSDVLFEAPNWSLDGRHLLVNGEGILWSVDARPGAAHPRRIPYTGLPEINNDHVLSPDGRSIYLSANDGHIYRASLDGGGVERVTSQDGVWHFLHGVSPDGARLACVRMTSLDSAGVLAVVPAAGGGTSIVHAGGGHIDGPEWSPDGEWLYLNSEQWAEVPGHAQLARVPEAGGELERLVESPSVDWFPHLSPDGRRAVYLRFPRGTTGHPANLDVSLLVVDTADWSRPTHQMSLRGGQGTINVNSWSPDSSRFAYVSYPQSSISATSMSERATTS